LLLFVHKKKFFLYSFPMAPTAPEAEPHLPRGNRPGVPPPRLYIYFDAIIRHGSIRSAAEALRIASSALNRRVLDLEREVGTILFDRLPSGVRLTAAGEIFAAHVRRTLSDIKQIGEQIHDMQGRIGGHVAIASAESAAIDLLPQLMVTFQSQYPGTRFTLGIGAPRDILADLLEDRADLILTHEEPEHHDVAVLAIARMPFCALMQPNHPLAAARELYLSQCLDFPIVLAQEHLAARALVEATLTASSLKMQPVLVTNMFEVMKKYVRLTNSISFQFHLAPFGNVTLDGLVAVPLADPQMAETRISLAVRRGRVLPASAAAVCEQIQNLLASTPR
jgi:DNA-binding transcriptional LysR family regulator